MKVDASELRDILEGVFSNSPIPQNLQKLKMGDFEEWDSLGNFNLLLAIEERLSVRFNIEAMASIKSIQDLVTYLESYST
jgi:acyl carrier protein